MLSIIKDKTSYNNFFKKKLFFFGTSIPNTVTSTTATMTAKLRTITVIRKDPVTPVFVEPSKKRNFLRFCSKEIVFFRSGSFI